MEKILLVDFENVVFPKVDFFDLFKSFDKIYLVMFNSTCKIDIGFLIKASPYIKNDALVSLQVPHGGKNSSDIAIAFLAGHLASFSHKPHIYIISRDGIFKNLKEIAPRFNMNVQLFWDYETAIRTANRSISSA